MKLKTNPIIAIDGYSSTGKSSYAKMLAKDFNWIHIDSGAMYRAVTLYALENCSKNNEINQNTLISNLKSINISFLLNPDKQTLETYLNNKNVELKIRDIQVSDQVSFIAKIAEVRSFLVSQQRKIGQNGGVVMDGRDIGTVVFPNADVKIFITANLEERAKRRFNELKQQNNKITLEEVQENLRKRDFIDENREIAPLVKAKDAILIDNSNFTKEETYNKILDIINKKLTS